MPIPQNPCYNCFAERPQGEGPCPFCGYDPKEDREKYPMALPHGSVLNGQYIVGRVLGQGGFGITYLAWDHVLRAKAAIKEFLPEGMAVRTPGTSGVTVYSGERQENFSYGAERFLDEARVLAKFSGNRNIAAVRCFFNENNTAYFAMDYIEGVSFKSYIKNHGGRVSFEDALRILTPVLRALSDVHREGLIHRDVTPDNIYITRTGEVRLLDFGSARYSLGDKSKSLDVVLKAGYAPKEQYIRRGRQGPYTDIYSVAACFYAAVTGYLPPEALERMEDDNLVPPSTRGVRLPACAEDAIMKGLELNASDRFQTAEEFLAALYPPAQAGPVVSAGAAQGVPVQTAPVPNVPVQSVSAQSAPVRVAPGPNVPAQSVIAQGVTVREVPAPGTPAPGVPVQFVPAQGAPVPGVPVQDAPNTARPVKSGFRLSRNDGLAVGIVAACTALSVVLIGAAVGRSGDSGDIPAVEPAASYAGQEDSTSSSELPDAPVEMGYVLNRKYTTPTGLVCYYTGDWKDDMPNGQGTGVYPPEENNGAKSRTYTGSWRDGFMDGHGKIEWGDGDSYEGDFSMSKMEGEGTYLWSDGRRYEGHWVQSKRDGVGTMTYKDGDQYTGDWKDDAQNGKGIYTWGEDTEWAGDRYEGDFADNNFNGHGVYYHASGSRYEGNYVDGKRNGYGVYTWGENTDWAGRRYEGNYVDGERSGQGTMYYADGDTYSGAWENDQKNGQGTYTWADGHWYEGLWEDGDALPYQGAFYKADGTADPNRIFTYWKQ